MSSFFAHSLMAVSIYFFKPSSLTEKVKNICWLLWLIVLASLPDLDYVVPWLHSSANNGLRITHSLIFFAIALILTVIVLSWLKIRRQEFVIYSCSAIAAGLSHLLLDLLVGVTPLPLLFPLSQEKFELPFGVLPSAGKIDLNNYYFYRNFALEVGVLIPLFLLLCLWRQRKIASWLKETAIVFLLPVSIYFIHQCYLLPR